jgi:hypothetical protein
LLMKSSPTHTNPTNEPTQPTQPTNQPTNPHNENHQHTPPLSGCHSCDIPGAGNLRL